MPIDTFTKEQFEDALPIHKETDKPLWKPLGLIGGEYTYLIIIDDKTGIEVRSSVRDDGVSADTGKDSIRAWLVTYEEKPAFSHDGTLIVTHPLGSKVNKYTTRLPGWKKRMTEVLRTLWGWRRTAGNCPICDEPKGIYRVKKDGKNKGRVFTKCDTHYQGTFKWFD